SSRRSWPCWPARSKARSSRRARCCWRRSSAAPSRASPEQLHLVAGPGRDTEPAKVQRRQVVGQAVAALGGGEALAHQLGYGTLALHPLEPLHVVVPSAAHLADERHDAGGAVGMVALQPLAEQVLDFQRQAQGHVAG